MKTAYLPIRVTLGLVAIAHIIIGLIGVIPIIPREIILIFYGATLQITPQIEHIIQMFGAYMLTVGVLGLYAIWNPAGSRGIIYCLVFLLIVRVIQRLFFFGQAEAVFGISPVYYWGQTALFFIMAVALFCFRPTKTEK